MLKRLVAPYSYRFIKFYREKYMQGGKYAGWEKRIDNDPENVHNTICEALTSKEPCMISRFGSNELDATIHFRKNHPLAFLRYTFPFWVNENTRKQISINAGFFPNDNKHLAHFADLIFDVSKEIDILGTWVGTEDFLPIKKQCQRVKLMYLEPFWSKEPWTKVLKGEKILIIHPFEASILMQYKRRKLLFENPNTLPEFGSIDTIKAVQSIGGEKNGFSSWFDALHYMERQIDNSNFNIALIGCGAYGMPLAAYCKRKGKKAVHIGGALQLLFGIRGSRWEKECKHAKDIMNKYWVRPLDSEKPKAAQLVENACYW